MRTGKAPDVLRSVRRLKVSGCEIDTFAFLRAMPVVEQVYFLDCSSDLWHTLSGSPRIASLGLHNLKQNKKYLSDTSFLRAFPQLSYLYVNMLGVCSLPELPCLSQLQVVCGTFRNENAVRERYDFSSFRHVPNLQIFDGCAAVDRHRIPAESFVPILENPSLTSFSYTQMFRTEEKKVLAWIARYRPALADTTLSFESHRKIRRENFAD